MTEDERILSECATEVVRWFRETHPTIVLSGETYKGNVASIKILQKIGLNMFDEDDSEVYLKMRKQDRIFNNMFIINQ